MSFHLDAEFYFGLILGMGFHGGEFVIALPFVVLTLHRI